MYISLVVLPLSLFQEKGFEWAVTYNPLAHMIEFGRFLLVNEGTVSEFGIIYASLFSIVILLLGVLVFNKTEKINPPPQITGKK